MSSSDNLIQELKAIRDGVALYDASHYGQVTIQGPEAASFLHKVTSNDVQKLSIGEGHYNAILDRKGMVLSLFYLYHGGESEFVAVLPHQLTEKTSVFLTKMRFIQKVTIKDLSTERGLLLFIGPEAEPIARKAASGGGGRFLWKEELFGSPVWNFSAPKETTSQLRGELSATIPIVQENSFRLLKMSAGFPEYGIDIDETHILLELKTPVAYQRQKGCYPGQEVIERILAYGKGRTPRALSTLFIEGEHSVTAGTEVVSPSGEKAGVVTSALYHPLDQKTVVLAYVDQKYVDHVSSLRLTLHPPMPTSPPIS